MADEEPSAPPSQAGKGIGSKLTKKLGPLPVWGWGLVGVVAAYFVYKYISGKSGASASTATGAATTATPTDASGLSTPGSNGYQDNGQLTQLSQQLQTLQNMLGQGTGSGAGSSGAGATPGFSPLLTVGDVMNAARQGKTIFEETAPGVFTPTSYTTATLTGFSKFSPSALVSETGAVPLFAGTTTGASVSGAGGSASPVGGTAGPPAPIVPPGRPGVGNGPATGVQSRPPGGIASQVA